MCAKIFNNTYGFCNVFDAWVVRSVYSSGCSIWKWSEQLWKYRLLISHYDLLIVLYGLLNSHYSLRILHYRIELCFAHYSYHILVCALQFAQYRLHIRICALQLLDGALQFAQYGYSLCIATIVLYIINKVRSLLWK